MPLFNMFNRLIDGFDDIVCPYCFEIFNSNDVHFRGLPDSGKHTEDDIYNQNYHNVYLGKTTQRKTFPPAFIPKGRTDPRLRYENVLTSDGKRHRVVQAYTLDDGRLTNKRICPHCHNNIGSIGLKGPNKIVSVLGYTQVGKTHYITSLLDYLVNIAPRVGPRNISCSFISGEDTFQQNLAEYKHTQLKATNVVYIEPIIINLSIGNDNPAQVFISFYDFPGEATQEDIDRKTIAAHRDKADGYLLLFDLTKTASFWEKAKVYQKNSLRDKVQKSSNPLTVERNVCGHIKDIFDSYFSGALTGIEEIFKDYNDDSTRFEIESLFCDSNLDKNDYEQIRRKIANENVVFSKQESEKVFQAIVKIEEYCYEILKENISFFVQDQFATEDDDSTVENEPSVESTDVMGLTLNNYTSNTNINDKKAKTREFKISVFPAFAKQVMTLAELSSDKSSFYQKDCCRKLYSFIKHALSYENNRVELIHNTYKIDVARYRQLEIECRTENLETHSEFKGSDLGPYSMFENWLNNIFFGNNQRNINKPTAFVGTKSDMVYEILSELSHNNGIVNNEAFQRIYTTMNIIRNPEEHKGSYYSESVADQMDTCLRHLMFIDDFSQVGIKSDNNLKSITDTNFNNYKYFAVSALGTKYVTDETGNTKPESNVSSWRVADPLFWLLHELGIM